MDVFSQFLFLALGAGGAYALVDLGTVLIYRGSGRGEQRVGLAAERGK